VKLGLGCCHGGTATLCPVHRHPCGGDRLEAESSRLPWGHRHPLSCGTATPRAVPTWTWLKSEVWRWSLSMTVYTAMVGVMHRLVLSGATVPFLPRAAKVGLVTIRALLCLGQCTTLFI
jgi:hypothetical protein